MLNLMEREFSKQPVRVSKAVWSRMLVSPPPILAVKILCTLLYLCDYQMSWWIHQHRNGIILICFLMRWIQTQCLTKKKVEMKYKEVLQVLGMTVCVAEETIMDANWIVRWAEDKAGACDSHDSAGENVREEQGRGHHKHCGSAWVCYFHLYVINISICAP